MQKQSKTIYQAARHCTSLTQEAAAERLHISVESIRAYERGATIPPSDAVGRMIETYGTKWLAYQHLKTADPVGQKYLPDIEYRELSSSILDLQVTMRRAFEIQYDIAEVGRDNRIDKHERPVYGKCISTIQSLIGAAFSVVFAPITEEKPPVLAHKAAR